MAGDDAGEEEPADPAVRAELGEAIGRVVDRNPLSLPAKLDGGCGKREAERPAEPGHRARGGPQSGGPAIKHEEPGPGALAQREGRRPDPDPRVVLLILMGVDR